MGESDDDRLELTPHLGEYVLLVRAAGRIRSPFHQAGFEEPVQAGGEDVARDAQAGLEIPESGDAPKQRMTNDHQAPSLADDLERTSCRAVLGFVSPAEHVPIVQGVVA